MLYPTELRGRIFGCAGRRPVAIEAAIILAWGQNANPLRAFEIARNRAEVTRLLINETLIARRDPLDITRPCGYNVPHE